MIFEEISDLVVVWFQNQNINQKNDTINGYDTYIVITSHLTD